MENGLFVGYNKEEIYLMEGLALWNLTWGVARIIDFLTENLFLPKQEKNINLRYIKEIDFTII